MAASIPFDAPDGYHWQHYVREDWRPVRGKRCRSGASRNSVACGKPSIAELNRGRDSQAGRVDSWWAYCLEHMYGNWLEDGKIWGWRLVENANEKLHD